MSATKSTIPRPSVAALRQLYIEDGLGCPEIGRRFGRDAKTVFWWLKQAGIPTRPRGANAAVQFQPGARSAFAGRRHTPESLRRIRDASIRRGAVPYLRSGVHWLVGLPPDANPNWKGGGTAERQDFYRTDAWREACRIVWVRADAHCERCGADHRDRDRQTEREFHIHHIVSFAVPELRAEPSNLVLLCWPCHRFVHSKANVAGEFLRQAEREAATPTLFDLFKPDEKEAA